MSERYPAELPPPLPLARVERRGAGAAQSQRQAGAGVPCRFVNIPLQASTPASLKHSPGEGSLSLWFTKHSSSISIFHNPGNTTKAPRSFWYSSQLRTLVCSLSACLSYSATPSSLHLDRSLPPLGDVDSVENFAWVREELGHRLLPERPPGAPGDNLILMTCHPCT